jgi:hypothetical protein
MTPHLVHIGWAKAGSSILQSWFAAHPQIAFARAGVMGVRRVFDIANGQAPEPAGIRLRVTSEESLSTPHPGAGADIVDYFGHAGSPTTAERVCEHLRDLFPDAWILVVTRGFREALVSSYSQAVKIGAMGYFPASDPSYGGVGHPADGKWNYGQVISLYEKAFPGKVIVLPYELLRDDPAKFLSILTERFGLKDLSLPSSVDNPSLSALELAWYPFFSRFVRHAPLPGPLKTRLLRGYLHAISRGRLRRLAQVCQRLRPRPLPTAASIHPAVLARLAGQGQCLRGRQFYDGYLPEYLLTV